MESHACCLKSSVGVLFDGFAIATRTLDDPLVQAISSFSSSSVKNFVCVLVILVLSAAIGLWLLEHVLPSLDYCWNLLVWFFTRRGPKPSLPRKEEAILKHMGDGIYWALTTLSTVGYGDRVPTGAFAKVWTSAYFMATIAALAAFSSILSANITTSILLQTGPQSLSEVAGATCIETNYQLLSQFIDGATAKPNPLVYDRVGGCMNALVNGSVNAV
jgi:hypothetical protein